MRLALLIMLFALPARAAVDLAASSPGTADSRAPAIDLIQPGDSDEYHGEIEFLWHIDEDSLATDADAVTLRVRTQSDELLLVTMPMLPAGEYSYLWIIEEPLPPETWWEVEARDYFGNAALAVGGFFSSTDVTGDGAAHGALLLERVWPNPLNPAARIRFSLPAAGEVDLSIHDLSGRRLATLRRGLLEAGQHELTWRATGLSSGVYWVRLAAGKQVRGTKLVVIK
jgi:hypothetical protein